MKVLNQINSSRGAENYPSLQIVFEWEDIISAATGLPVSPGHSEYHRNNLRLEKYHLVWIKHLLTKRTGLNLKFVMTAYPYRRAYIDKFTIPVIIDFWLKDSEIMDFVNSYRICPVVLATNREVYEKIRAFAPDFPIEHWPLSFPDKYRLDENAVFEKEYEFGVFGRPNPFFLRLLEEYSVRHPDFTYIVSKGTEWNREFYTDKGEFIAKDEGRASYLNMLRKTKITCYTTPGCDESKKVPAPYNQVTPRLFEMLCSGCQVIGHYPVDTADVAWYDLQSVVPNVDTYDEFEKQMNIMRKEPFAMNRVCGFMEKHYTTSVIPALREILKKYCIQIRREE